MCNQEGIRRSSSERSSESDVGEEGRSGGGGESEEENSLKVLESNRLPLDPKYHELDLEIMPLQR